MTLKLSSELVDATKGSELVATTMNNFKNVKILL